LQQAMWQGCSCASHNQLDHTDTGMMVCKAMT